MLIDESKNCSAKLLTTKVACLNKKKLSTEKKLLIQQKLHQTDIEGIYNMHKEKTNLLIKKIKDVEKNNRTLLDQHKALQKEIKENNEKSKDMKLKLKNLTNKNTYYNE